MQVVTNVLNKPLSQKQVKTLFFILFAVLFGFYGYLFATRRPPAATVGTVIPGRTSFPVFDMSIYGGFDDMQFDKPLAVTAANGRIYVSDSNNARIQVFDNRGEFLFTFGEKGKSAGQFSYPYGLAADNDGNIYVADLYRGRIQIYDADGEYLRDFAAALSESGTLKGPGDVVIVGDTLYVTDINENRILVIDLETEKLQKIVGLRLDLLAPNGIAVDEAGYMYVVDTGRQRVVVYRPDGNPVRVINGTPSGYGINSVLINPRGIGVDRAGNIYVVSNLSHTIYVFNREGRQIHSFGGSGDGNNNFMFPNGLHIDSAGRILITDTSNQRVVVYR